MFTIQQRSFPPCFGLHDSSHHLSQAVEIFNSLVSQQDAVSVESLLSLPVSQKSFSSKFTDHDSTDLLLNTSSVEEKA